MIHSFTKALLHRMTCRPNAWAAIRGGEKHPRLVGTAKFYQTTAGVLVQAEIWGLPGPQENPSGIFAFHLHEGTDCGGDAQQEFSDTKGHLNPQEKPHPEHMGDLPPLFAQNGYAWSAFLIGRFTIRDILNRTVVIHSGPDDFTTQPAGNSGEKIACGVIK